jgi:hypothetical protein
MGRASPAERPARATHGPKFPAPTRPDDSHDDPRRENSWGQGYPRIEESTSGCLSNTPPVLTHCRIPALRAGPHARRLRNQEKRYARRDRKISPESGQISGWRTRPGAVPRVSRGPGGGRADSGRALGRSRAYLDFIYQIGADCQICPGSIAVRRGRGDFFKERGPKAAPERPGRTQKPRCKPLFRRFLGNRPVKTGRALRGRGTAFAKWRTPSGLEPHLAAYTLPTGPDVCPRPLRTSRAERSHRHSIATEKLDGLKA